MKKLSEKELWELDKAVLIDILCSKFEELENYGIFFCKEEEQ